MIFVNANEFSRTAQFFSQKGIYTQAPKGSKDWRDFWIEERRRCDEGFSVGGVKITGDHYHYLNFCPIELVDRNVSPEGIIQASRVTGFPKFYDGDYDFFWACHIARHGMAKAEYDALQLGVSIQHLSGGKHLIVLKARRKGYSYKCGGMCSNRYFHKKRSKSFILADKEEYLSRGDGILDKTWKYLSHIDEHTAFTQPRLNDTNSYKRNGYKQDVNGTDVEKGFLSMIMGTPINGDPDKGRGKAGDLVLFEEGGSFPKLRKTWEVLMPTLRQGDATLGLGIIFGTGGSEGADFESMEEMFYSPEAYDMLAIDNTWDEGASGNTCGFFVPITRNLEGFIDDNGNSVVDKAIDFELQQRESKKKARDPKAVSSYMAEHPFTPQEAMLNVYTNIFPTHELNAQYNKVKSRKLDAAGVAGMLIQDDKRVVFNMDEACKPITSYPHSAKDDLRGAVVIYEAPFRMGEHVPDNLYIICTDPYTKDQSKTMESLGSIYVLKRPNQFSLTHMGSIVAQYVGRPSTVEEWNRILFLLSEYYNAQIGMESNAGSILDYARRNGKLNRLMRQATIVSKSSDPNSTSYGINMTADTIEESEVYLRDWLLDNVGANEYGQPISRLSQIVDLALLRELIKYNDKGNFDRVRALQVGMYYLKDTFRKKVSASKTLPYADFFNRKLFQ